MTASVTLKCPHCGAATTLSQVQGDRCDGCGFELKWFGPDERRAAQDYLAVVTGDKHLDILPDGLGFVVVHA